MTHSIKNYAELARTPARRDALDIIEAGLAAINTAAVVRSNVFLNGDELSVGSHSYDLKKYKHIYVIGLGKASCQAVSELERILGNRIYSGITISNETKNCHAINTYEATHPLPSRHNFELTELLVKECEKITGDDLVIVVVSGGGSAMLCFPESECEQGSKLYAAANRNGLAIHELNVVRKHISTIKGGGLVKLLHPATVVGLIFSDVSGATPDMVASGPTYLDLTTNEEAQAIIDKYWLGSFELFETSKDESIFSNVTNIVLVSNEQALQAMSQTAQQLGYMASIIGNNISDEPEKLINLLLEHASPHSVVLCGGEARLTIPSGAGIGGRNQHLALTGATMLQNGQLFASIASDGIDNGDCAGAIVDNTTTSRAKSANMDADEILRKFNERTLLEETRDAVFIGPTGANVSDLMLLITP